MENDGWALEEASLLRELDHECICKLYDAFECPEENVTCLVMQYASGGDLLARIIKSGPLTERTATDIVRQLLQALKSPPSPISLPYPRPHHPGDRVRAPPCATDALSHNVFY